MLSLSGGSLSKAKPYKLKADSRNLTVQLDSIRTENDKKFEEYCKRLSKYVLVKKH